MSEPTSQMQAVLDAHKAMGPLPIETLTAEIARQIPLADKAAQAVYGQHFLKRAMAPMPLPVGAAEHKQIQGQKGNVLLRIYTPAGTAPEAGWPVLVYYHGGGWVIATLDTYDASARALCEGAQCVVVSAHYRQAPEHPFPAAYEDALSAYSWVEMNARSLKGNPSKIAIAGESAGGNLAAVVAQTLRDKGSKLPLHQLLVYPVTDLVNGPLSASAKLHANAKPLNTAMLNWFYDQYAPNLKDRSNPYISPLNGEMKGLPEATVILAEIDPLQSEGENYANQLNISGVPVERKLYKGVTHEFFGMVGLVDEATEAMKFACDRLKAAFNKEQAQPSSSAKINADAAIAAA